MSPLRSENIEGFRELRQLLTEAESLKVVPKRISILTTQLKTEIKNSLEGSSTIDVVTLVKKFFQSELTNEVSARTYESAFERFCSWCEVKGIRLTAVEYSQVLQYCNDLKDSYKPGTVIAHMSVLRTGYDFLMRKGHVPANPVPVIRNLKGEKLVSKKTPLLTLDEVESFLDAFDTENKQELRDRAVSGVFLFAFASVGSVPLLKINDYKSNEDTASIKLQMGGSSYDVPLHPRAAGFIDDYLEERSSRKDNALFPPKGKWDIGMSRVSIFNMTKKMSKRAKIREVTPTQLRLTGMAALLQAIPQRQEIKDMLGNRHPDTITRHELGNKANQPALGDLFASSDITKPLEDFVIRTGLFAVKEE